MKWGTRAPVIGISLLAMLYFCIGVTLIPYAGIQNDEAVFTTVLFDNPLPKFELSIFKKKVGLMVMSYLGSTKAALLALVWKLFEPSAYSLRVPALLLGVASLFFLYGFLRRAAGERVAVLATALAATDTSYLVTTVFDWGPVAIQHLSLLMGLYFLLRAYQTARPSFLAAGCFMFGFGMWDKAVFAWMLIGAAVATTVAFPGELKRYFSGRRVAVSAVFFLLGALPLVIYNIRRPLETLRANTQMSSDDLRPKLYQLPSTANGSALFGFIVEEEGIKQRTAVTPLERAAVTLSEAAGNSRANLNWYAFAVSLLLTPALWFTRYRRQALFLLVMMSVAWVLMLSTKGAGGGAHHTVLMWPFPLVLVAMCIAELGSRSKRWGSAVVALVMLLLCGAAILTSNHYLAHAIRFGGTGTWTDAHYKLTATLKELPASRIALIDWGMYDNTRMLVRAKLPLVLLSHALSNADPGPTEIAAVHNELLDRKAIFVSNTDERQLFPGVNARLRKVADGLGLTRQEIETVYDSRGVACFEVFRFVRAGSVTTR